MPYFGINDYNNFGNDFGDRGATFGNDFRDCPRNRLNNANFNSRFDNDGIFRSNNNERQWNVQTTPGRFQSNRNDKYDFDNDASSVRSRESLRRKSTFGRRPLRRMSGRRTGLSNTVGGVPPVVNVYNDVFQDDYQRAESPHPPYPPESGYEGRRQRNDRLGDDLIDRIEDLEIDRRRSRARGRDDVSSDEREDFYDRERRRRSEERRIRENFELEGIKSENPTRVEASDDTLLGRPLPIRVEEEVEAEDGEEDKDEDHGDEEEDDAEDRDADEKAIGDVEESKSEDELVDPVEPQPSPAQEEPTSPSGLLGDESKPTASRFGNVIGREHPVYPKIHRRYISRHTLKYYDVPWEYNLGDRRYIIILREMDKDETEVIFEHTKQWRERQQVDAEQVSSDSESDYDHVYRRGRSDRYRRFGDVDSDSDSLDSESAAVGSSKPFLVFDFDSTVDGAKQPRHLESIHDESGLYEPKTQRNLGKESKPFGSTLDCVFNAAYNPLTNIAEYPSADLGSIEIVPRGPVSSPSALFHLRHIQQDTLDFEKFKKAVLDIRELRNVKSFIEDDLNGVQKKFEHSADIGKAGRSLDSFVHKNTRDVRNHGDLTITTICMPFVCLGRNHHESIARLSLRSLLRMTQEDTSSSSSIKSNTAHSARTLFQSLYARGDSRRDLNQAICHVSDQVQGRYLYVSQLWALVIDRDVLITCSTLSRKELFGDVITTQPATLKGKTDKPQENYVRVETPGGSIWNLSQADCRTYFDFVAHFSQYTTSFATESQVVFKGEVVQPHQWPEILAAAKDSTLNVRLRRVSTLYDEYDLEKFIVPEAVDSTLVRRVFGLGHDLSPSQMDAARKTMDAAVVRPGSESTAERFPAEHEQAFISAHGRDPPPESTINHKAEQERTHTEKLVLPLERDLAILGGFCRIMGQHPQAVLTKELNIPKIDAGLPSFVVENFNIHPVGFADEDQLFEHCEGITPQIFIDGLRSLTPRWFAFEEGNPITRKTTDDVRSDDSIPLEQWPPIALASLHNGLRSLISLFLWQQTDNGPAYHAFQKLLQAVLLVNATYHEVVQDIKMFPKPKQKSIYRHLLGLDELFRITTELEAYSITYEAMLERIRTATDEYIRIVKHCTTTLLITVKVAREHVLLGPRLEKQLLEEPDKTRTRLIDELNVSLGVLDRAMQRKPHENHASMTPARSVLEREAEALSKEGWDNDVAMTVLKTHFGERRVLHRSRAARRMFNRTFEKALKADPSKAISDKAAALPLDVFNILLPRILHMPVYKDQDALHMYNQYLTELESNILAGEASREPLERLRYLKHELNAFSIIQNQQLSTLKDLKESMFPDVDSIFAPQLYRIPHPGPRLLDRTIKHLELQNANIQGLDALIDTPQSEAQAAIAGMQDWRDNATVVFTVITIIFLPLSFVASVLGMNTSEIRSMGLNQWVFWASAIPFTLLVICVTLYFVEVPPLRRWLERKGVLQRRRG